MTTAHKKDIMVIRESISRIVSMLTSQSIKVTQRGSQARVSYHPTKGHILGINLPFIPDDASEEFISAVQGFLDHEVGHVLFSDFPALKRANKLGPRIANMANLIEDVFIERKMTAAFQGSGSNLESVRRFYLEKICRPKIEEAIKAGNTEEARGYATVAAFRAWGGQAVAMDFIKEPAIAELVESVRAKLGAELIDQLTQTKNSDDCLNLATKMVKKLEAPKPPPAPKAPPSPPPPPPPPPLPEPEVPDPDYDEEAGEEEGEPGDSADVPETDLAGALKPEEKKPESPPPAADGPEADDDTGPDDETAPADEDDEDDHATGGTKVESDSPDGVDKGGPGDKEDDDGVPTGAEEGETGAPDAPHGPGGTPGAADVPYEEDPLASMFDEERDFDKDMSERLSKEAASEIDASDYAVFSKEWDVITLAPAADRDDSIERMEGELGDKLGVMQKMLERSIAAQARKAWLPGQRRGRIAPASLFKTAAGDDRVFRQRFETKAKNTAVSLVVDCSGSMCGSKIRIAGQAAYALSTILERLKITHEVIGFTTTSSAEMRSLMASDAKTMGKDMSGMGWGRIEPLYLPVFKQFNGRLDTSAKSRLAGLQEAPHWLSQNVDGECIQIAAARLKQQKAERHVMIVLSDGEPAAMAARGLSAHLKKTVKTVSSAGVEVIGIGIESNAVKSFYPKHIVLNDAAELPGRVMAELTRLLLAP